MRLNIKVVQPFIVFCTLAVFSLLSSCRAASLTLVQGGKPKAEIVISEQPERTVRLAAQQLQDYIKKISGAKLPIVTKPSGNAVKVFVGQSSYTDALKVSTKGLKANGSYRIKTGANWMVLIGIDTNFTPVEPWAHRPSDFPRAQAKWDKITGTHWGLPTRGVAGGLYKFRISLPGSIGKPEGIATKRDEVLALWQFDKRGSFNAVCGLLRDFGVRWYMPGEVGEVVPKIKTISLPQMDKATHPDFPIRRMYLPFRSGHDTAMWAMHLGLNRPYRLLMHGMVPLVQNSKVYAAHPDWFAMYGGKRRFEPSSTHNQLCYSNPGLFEAAVRYARLQFDTYHYDFVSIMPPDAFTSICQCPLCTGKDHPERGSRGHLSNYVWDFVNRVAKEVAKTNPGKLITCCAYGPYSLPPTNIAKLAPNVQVLIVGGRRIFSNNPEDREQYRQLRKEWEAKTDNPIMVFENYPRVGRGFYLPAYQPHAIGESINATKGISRGEDVWFNWSSMPTTDGIGFNHFMIYFTARMYWGGKNADVDAMFREYCQKFYGPAADEMHSFFTYCEANWRDMSKDKTKADEALALFAKAKAKVDVASVYGKRIAFIDEYLNGLRNKSKQLGKKRGPVPVLRLVNKSADAKGIVINGKLDDAYWQDLPSSSTGYLRNLETGQTPTFGTSFKAAMSQDGHNVYFAIRCEDRPGEKLNDMSTKKDDQAMWMGDCIEIELETESHSYYQIAVSPSGVIADLDRDGGKQFDWDSQAEVATHIGDGYWTVEIRITVTTNDSDPLHQVVGHKPTQSLPWFFNIYRQRIRENGYENSAFSPTGVNNFHEELKFAYFYVGRLHKFAANPDDDYLHDISTGDYTKAATRPKITNRQKSYALELAAAKERDSKQWNAADKIATQIPIEAVQKTVQMKNLFAQGKAPEVIKNFGSEDISQWPFWKRSDGYFIRGQAYAATNAGKEAVADYKHALEFTNDWRMLQKINLELGRANEYLLKDDTAALAAYHAADNAHPGLSGSVELGAVQGIARILTRQGKYDEALKELDRIIAKKLKGYWNDSTLLARGATLEAAGRKTEAAAIYKKILADKSTQPRSRKAAEAALQKMH